MAVRTIWLSATAVVICGALAGCASDQATDKANLATTLVAPDAKAGMRIEEQTIKINDKLNINVWPAKDITPSVTRVDTSGNILLPPLGTIIAQGKTPAELATVVQQRLKDCCLQNPQVEVMITETTLPQVNVMGAVTVNGLYPIREHTTLTEAISMAKGPERTTANLKAVYIQRTINGQRARAMFDLEAILAGRAEDPEVFGGDTITVETSKAKSAWRNTVSVVPLLGVFTTF